VTQVTGPARAAPSAGSEGEGVVAGFGVKVSQRFGQDPLEDADAVGVAEGVPGVHGLDVGGLVVRVQSDGDVEEVGRGLRIFVEQTCTHAVVVHKGEIVASGPVDDIVGESRRPLFRASWARVGLDGYGTAGQ
jgi:hypothetical protein